MTRLVSFAVVSALAAGLPAQEQLKPQVARTATADDGFIPLFNGKNLHGWVNVNCHPSTFSVKDGEIVTTGKPTGFLRTDKQYENFVLEMDWMHVNKKDVANSGLFVWGDPLPAVGTPYTRGIEVQVLINYPKVDWATNHGDIFSIHGAHCKPDRPHPKGYERCLPSEERVKGAGEWNHYKVTANNGAIKLEVNGKEVSGVSQCTPRKGYLALESEGAECHFKNITIKELPSTNPKPEECAKVDEGFQSLFNGLDLKGWENEKESWKATDGKMVAVGKEDIYFHRNKRDRVGHGELIFDWKLPQKSSGEFVSRFGPVIVQTAANGTVTLDRIGNKPSQVDEGKSNKVKLGAWNRTVIAADAKKVTITINGEKVIDVPARKQNAAAAVGFSATNQLEIMNIFFREPKEEK
jgi:hypothetical protein